MTLLESIKRGVSSMLKSDQKLAYKFIEERQFRFLLELVDSNIRMLIKNRIKDNPNPELESLEESDLCILKLNLENYLEPYGEEII